jgi:hypothetical protein
MPNPESEPTSQAEGPDPELEQLPAPRHPWRRTTIVALVVCLLSSVALIFGLRGELAYTMKDGQPRPVGPLASLSLEGSLSNRWIHAEGELDEFGGIRYGRPFEPGTFRLVPVQGNRKLWVQIRIPVDFEDEHFVPPSTFVGRLAPLQSLGLRYSALRDAVEEAGWPRGQLPDDAWVLIDGESPQAIRWVLALSLVLFGFAGFCVWATTSVLRRARST